MDSIKQFFDKKKKDAKFKMAGQGRRLTADSSDTSKSKCHTPKRPLQRFTPLEEASRAGQAALTRVETSQPKEVNWSLQSIKAQAKREMEAEKKMTELRLEEEKQSGFPLHATLSDKFNLTPMLATQGVFFHCPLLGPDVDTYDEIKRRIREFLYNQLHDDKAVVSCLVIHTCNKNKEKITVCVETLCRYLDNILSNSTESKYRKIRQLNRAFLDRVVPMEGHKQFLEAAGFEEQDLPLNKGTEKFWVFPDKASDLSTLKSLRDTLVSAEPLKPKLDRSLRVLLHQEAECHVKLPPDFFNLTLEELKREEHLRAADVLKRETLMTKAMREKLDMREMKKYRFSLIRVRFPIGIILQGTFAVNEKFRAIMEFVQEHLVNEWRPFFLTLSGGGKVSEEDISLFELHMVPAVLLNFEWDSEIQDPNLDNTTYLKEELMNLLQDKDH